MNRISQIASAALLAASLAPVAAIAAPSNFHVNTSVAQYNPQANQAAQNGFAGKQTPVALRHIGGAASDSTGG
nr:hypothetical protein [uncultured Acidocella sp.]